MCLCVKALVKNTCLLEFKLLLSLFVSCFSLENREPWTSFFSWMEIWKASPRGCCLWVCWAGQWAESRAGPGQGAWFPRCQWWIEPSFVFLAPPAVSFHRLYRSAPLLWLSHLYVNRFKSKRKRNSMKEKQLSIGQDAQGWNRSSCYDISVLANMLIQAVCNVLVSIYSLVRQDLSTIRLSYKL